MKDDGGPAFPTLDFYDEKLTGVTLGMSLRAYLAAHAPMTNTIVQAIQIVAKSKVGDRTDIDTVLCEELSRFAVRYADTVLVELEKERW